MGQKALSVGIIGGSIAGCATAIALSRAGCRVEVFERSARGLMDRGSGIAIPNPLREQLIAAGFLPQNYAHCPMKTRWWLYPDGTDRGRRAWTQSTAAGSNNWGMLWRGLREQVPDAIYHEGMPLTGFAADETGVDATFGDGSTRRFDLLVGADGYHSVVRGNLHPEVRPKFAGYVLWRGNYAESRLTDRRLIDAMDQEATWLTVPFPGGHGVLYPIPNFDNGTEPGRRRINWAIYAPLPGALTLDGVESVPPGSVTPEILADLEAIIVSHFPPDFAALIRHSRVEEVSIQPIFDSVIPNYVSGRVLLVGDAGSIPRPHTASGATKAIEDAMLLERLLGQGLGLDEVLSAYDKDRSAEAARVVGIGRRMGQAQVLDTPDWGAMDEARFEAWHSAILSGEELYLYGENGKAA